MIYILAPHPDDELIGCFSVLEQHAKNTMVLYTAPCPDQQRIIEALHLRNYYGHYYAFLENLDQIKDYIKPDDVLYVPHITDSHFEHKAVNVYVKCNYPNNVIYYYSVDMYCGKPLPADKAEFKRSLLYSKFPTQTQYFDQHPQCYLFEHIVDSDTLSTITVKTSFEGIHSYPGAPDEVSFLRYPHRHDFHVRVTLSVTHDDREVEFFMLKKAIDTYISDTFDSLDNKSCEMVAKNLLTYCLRTYPARHYYEVTVGEDGQNEATLKFETGIY